jgi:signal peptidase I
MASSRRKSGGFSDMMKTLLQVILLALVVRSFAYEPFNIPSKSMQPTLLVGDFIVVSKFSYGYSRHSLPFSLHLFDGRIFFHQPQRGDVVVFKVPIDNRTDYIKRLIGLPGDHIKVEHRVLSINGVAVKRQAVEDYVDRDPRSGNTIRHLQYIETLPQGRSHIIIEDAGPEIAVDNTADFVVPPGHYFMMGDNRDNSLDSRVPPEAGGVGYVPEENLVGRAEIIFLSTTQAGKPWQFWQWPSDLRWRRLFDRIV